MDKDTVKEVRQIEGKAETDVDDEKADDAADADEGAKPDSEDESTLVSFSTSLVGPSTSSVAPSKAAEPSLYIMPRAEHGAILAPWLVFAQEWPKKVRDAIDRVEQAAVQWDAMDD